MKRRRRSPLTVTKASDVTITKIDGTKIVEPPKNRRLATREIAAAAERKCRKEHQAAVNAWKNTTS